MARIPRFARRTLSTQTTNAVTIRTSPAPAEEPQKVSPTWSATSPDQVTRRDPIENVPFELRVAAGYAWRLIVIGVALWGLMKILAATTSVVIPLAVAILLTGLLMPMTVFLNHKLGMARHAASAVTMIVFLSVVVGLLSLAGSQLVAGVTDLVRQAGVGVDRVTAWLEQGPLHLGGDQIAQYIQSGRAWLTDNSKTLTTGVLRASDTAKEFFAGALIALISTFFFLAEGDRIWAWTVRLLPGIMRDRVHEAFRRGYVTLGAYAKTQCVVAAVDAVFITIGAWALGLPLLIPMGLIIFFGSFIPIIGAVISASLAVLVAFVVKGPFVALIMLAIILVVQQVEGHILQPVLMSKAVSLHPLAVILGVVLGSFLLGMVGALFSVPFMAVINTVMLYWAGHDMFPGLADGMSAVGNSAKELSGEKNGSDDIEAVEEQAQDSTRYIGDITPEHLEKEARRLAKVRSQEV
ncbi:Predicted PurR-regulated permease PerM [Austwickia chelonae]|uniref:AI-2E family transporter n=1 Tax=Austwickia chelonae NBRC 105200 TaxID=1184607 RepID=K6V8A9_9MICO|nr:hypothetical protein AUCHE_09_00630 [Austwickia chelonae NBRC 105200]SEW39775.1 Predicted PurR-regulated permease PerM [Austwickia chelonae]